MAATSPVKSTANSVSTLAMPSQQSSSAPAISSSTTQSIKPMASGAADVKPSQKLLDQFMKEKFPTSAPAQGSSSTTGLSGNSNVRARSLQKNSQDTYARKLRKMKRTIKDAIFVNGAICDEVLRTEEKLAKAKEERRFLLRKLLQYQNVSEPTVTSVKSEPQTPASRLPKAAQANTLSSEVPVAEHTSKPAKAVKRKVPSGVASAPVAASSNLVPAAASTAASLPGIGGPSEAKKKNAHAAKDILDNLQVRPKKGKGTNKKIIPPLMLDSLGRPVFPMYLEDITLHSIGEIVPDRLSFHSPESIYPAGYCITRVYTSLHKLDTKCLYTCKISDNNDGALFEIAAEDSSDIIFKANTPQECHSLLIRAVNKSRGGAILPTEGHGLDFFGLSHPVIQNLIQSCPGARKCSRYKWVKFEINKAETNENVAVGTTDPTVSYEAFKSHMIAIGQKRATLPAHVEQSTNLRSLLTKGSSGLS